MEEIVVSGKLPVLALRGIVVFPNQTVHFDVAREKSVRAVDQAMEGEQLLFLIPQKNIVDGRATILMRNKWRNYIVSQTSIF